jgi:predicted hotdog family 3-hydroxylacyl-ACP dehydratase
MFLIDEVITWDRDSISAIATSHRNPANPLRHQGHLPGHAMIEYGAQTAGIHGGLLNRELFPDAPAQMGYLAVVSNLAWKVAEVDRLPGDLTIFARRFAVTPGGRAYHVRIEHRDEEIMSGDLIIALVTSGKDVV